MDRSRVSFLVRKYVKHIPTHTQGARAVWGVQWIRGTLRFGYLLQGIGIATGVLALLLPSDTRQWFVFAIGVVLLVVGMWHVSNARSICDFALNAQTETPDQRG